MKTYDALMRLVEDLEHWRSWAWCGVLVGLVASMALLCLWLYSCSIPNYYKILFNNFFQLHGR